MEDLGLQYFHELLSRSFFQPSNSKGSRFVMHDLINDLAQFVDGETCFNLNDKLEGNKLYTVLAKACHMSFTRHTYEVSQRFTDFHTMKRLRTFIALPIYTSSSAACCYISNNVFEDLLPQLRCLRVLSLSGYWISEPPSSIGGLKRLRYVYLSHTKIRWLPESLGSLLNLQTLILWGCRELTQLPQGIENLINLCCLDISDTNSLQEMPLQIGNLKSLQILPKFIVRKDNGFRIRELGDLSLRGKLSILGLHNVSDIREARDANLKEKRSLDELELECSDNFNDSRNEEGEIHVLGLLQPHKNLKKLTVSFYRGMKFPAWIGDPLFTNIVRLNLYNCRKSMSLPPLGRLPSLRELFIAGMDRVESSGFEFLGVGFASFKPFPSLETLRFENMLEWESWFCSTRADEEIEEEFPRLLQLMIRNCPKLTGKLPRRLSSLVKLNISQCPKLCPQLGSMEEIEQYLHHRLEDLKILSCDNLVSLPYGSHSLLSLKDLQIESCPKLLSLPETNFLSTLKILLLRNCPSLKSLPCGLMLLNCKSNKCLLEDLEIEECPSLISFPRGQLPCTLKRLKIRCCTNLQSLPEGIMHTDYSSNISYLEHLEISNCPSLTSFPAGKLPISLKILKIWGCSLLEPLLERILSVSMSLDYIDIWNCTTLTSLPECLHRLTHLTKLSVNSCPGLESFPKTGLHLPNLRKICIHDCVNLKSLPVQMHDITSLQNLTICGCPALVSFPRGGLPPHLTSVEIWDCENFREPMSEWNLHSLTSLRDFGIAGKCFLDTIFPDENCLLPTNVKSICIRRLDYLESLSIGLGNLTSLEELEIFCCPKLQILPKEGLPATLGRLSSKDCPFLR